MRTAHSLPSEALEALRTYKGYWFYVSHEGHVSIHDSHSSMVAEARAEGYRKGQEDMRERASNTIPTIVNMSGLNPNDAARAGVGIALGTIAALPIEPEPASEK